MSGLRISKEKKNLDYTNRGNFHFCSARETKLCARFMTEFSLDWVLSAVSCHADLKLPYSKFSFSHFS